MTTGCLTLVPNSLTRLKAYFKSVPVHAADWAAYMKDLVRIGFSAFNTRADELLRTLGDELVGYMTEKGIGFRFIVLGRKWGNSELYSELGQLLCRGDMDDLKNFLKVHHMDDAWKKGHLEEVISVIQDEGTNLYKPITVTEGASFEIPASARGFAPDFSKTPELLYQANERMSIQKITLTGVRSEDDKLANALAKLDGTPEGYTWHHLDDFDETGKCTMQLVRSELHTNNGIVKTIDLGHTGSPKIWRVFYNQSEYL